MLLLKIMPKIIMMQLLFSIVFTFSSCGKDNDFLSEDISIEQITEPSKQSIPYTGDAGNKDISEATAKRVFYVAVNGKSSNDGLTQQKPIDIKTSFDIDRIQPGDLYWVKAGDYGKINIELNQPNKTAGTKQNPIGWIGYKKTPGDIKALQGPTVSWDDYKKNNDRLDPSVMPTFTGDGSKAPNFLKNGKAFDLNHWKEYIVIRNFQIQQYEYAISMYKGEHNVFDNIIMANNGFFDNIEGQGGSNSDLKGTGIEIRKETGHIKITNSYTANMALIGFSISQNSSNNLIEWCNADSDKDSDHNPQDYFFHVVGKFNFITNIRARKLTESNHSGHGLCFNWDTNQKWGAQNNYAENVEILNTALHFDGEYTHDNTVKNIKIWDDRDHYIFGCGATIMDGAHHNTVENLELTDGRISFLDSGAHVKNGTAGHDNIFKNAVIKNNDEAISFGWWSTKHPAYNNTFIDCSFKNLDNIFFVARKNYGNKFLNSNFDNVRGVYFTEDKFGDFELSSTTEFIDCNFWGSKIPSSNIYKVSGTTEKMSIN